MNYHGPRRVLARRFCDACGNYMCEDCSLTHCGPRCQTVQSFADRRGMPNLPEEIDSAFLADHIVNMGSGNLPADNFDEEDDRLIVGDFIG